MGDLNHLKGLGAEVGVAAGAGLARGEEVVAAAAPDLDPGLQGIEGESDPGLGTGEAEAGRGEEARRGRGRGGGTSRKAGVGAEAPRRRDREAGAPRRRSRGRNQPRKRANLGPGTPQERNQSRARSVLDG